jgi:hypothetical protein
MNEVRTYKNLFDDNTTLFEINDNFGSFGKEPCQKCPLSLELNEARELTVGVSMYPELHPDLFNPILCGAIDYDQGVTAMSAILNVPWDHLTDADKALPFW